MKLYTGVGGYDLFETAMEESAGMKRVRIGNKVPRILRTEKAFIRKSPVGYWYKLIKTRKTLMDFLTDEERPRCKKEDFSLETLEKVLSEIFFAK